MKVIRGLQILSIVMFALCCVNTFAYQAHPEKILIKNETGEPITYSMEAPHMKIAFVWLEAGEEQNITEKYRLHEPLKYLRIAINLKEPAKMCPFSKRDSKEVDLGDYNEILITVYKRIYGPRHPYGPGYGYRPVVSKLSKE